MKLLIPLKRIFIFGILLFSTFLYSPNAEAKLKTQIIEYTEGGQVLHGYLAYDDSFKGKRPGILVTHKWIGLYKYAKMRSDQFAKLGYVAFAPDIYENGLILNSKDETENPEEKYKVNSKFWGEQAKTSVNFLKNHKLIDAKRGLLLVTVSVKQQL